MDFDERKQLIESRFYAKVRKSDGGCWTWMNAKNQDGYGIVDYEGRTMRAHRLAWLLQTATLPEGVLLHTCDNPGCVNLEHLEDSTQRENMRDKMAKGRGNVSKLSYTQACEILNATGSLKRLAEYYGVSQTTISNIKRGLTYRIQPIRF